jgi:mono/diheme cytochrome c family protein
VIKGSSLGCIAATLIIFLLPQENSFAASGEDVFKSNECGTCHGMTGSPAKSFAEQQEKKGPDLWYAGSKYQEQWLEGYLQEPTKIRPLAFGSITEENTLKHPALSADDAISVTAYLASQQSAAVTKGSVKAVKKNIKGKILFKTKQACYGCHRVPEKGGKESGGYSGPGFVGVGQRLQGDWIYSFLTDPSVFIGGGRMPHYKHLKANEIKAISEHMMSF